MSRLGAAVSTACCRGCWRSGGCRSLYCFWRSVVGWFCCDLVMGARNQSSPLVAAGNVEQRQGGVNEHSVAFKAEPDAGMLAEKEWQATVRVIADRMFHYCEVYSVLMNGRSCAAVGAEKKRYADVFNRLSMGDERALHWLRYLMALGLRKQYCWRRRQICALRRNLSSPYCRMAASESAGTDNYWLPSSEGQNGQTPFLLAEMLVWPASPRWSALLSTHRLSPSNSY